MSQPEWVLVANLGDVGWKDHGGYFVYKDDTGVYGFEAEYLEEPEPCDRCEWPPDEEEEPDNYRDWQAHVRTHERWTAYRILLERYKIVEGDKMVPVNWEPSWPHPASSYEPWFRRYLDSVASTVDSTEEELIRMFCSSDPTELAWAYRELAMYHGWHELDSDPIRLTSDEVDARYERDVEDIGKPRKVLDKVLERMKHRFKKR